MSTTVSRLPSRPLTRVAVGVGAASVLLVGCAEPTPVVTGGGTVAPVTAGPSRSGPGGSSASSPSPSQTTARPTTAAATRPAVWPTKTVDVNRTLADAALGHTVQVWRLLRGLPCRAGYTATSRAYELVAV